MAMTCRRAQRRNRDRGGAQLPRDEEGARPAGVTGEEREILEQMRVEAELFDEIAGDLLEEAFQRAVQRAGRVTAGFCTECTSMLIFVEDRDGVEFVAQVGPIPPCGEHETSEDSIVWAYNRAHVDWRKLVRNGHQTR